MKKQAKQTAGKATGPKKAIKKKVFRGGGEFSLDGCQGANCHTNDTSPSVNPPAG